MQTHLILWPLLVQITLPILVLLLNGKRKAADRKSGEIDLAKAAMDNTAWSKGVALTSLNLANQTQLPVLFYVICLVLAQLSAVTTFTLALAWVFVISRYVHAWAHVNGNIMAIRFPSFVFGALTLLVLLVTTFIKLGAADGGNNLF
jgi:hypothetical protein